jgi:hypothetical protein
MTFQRHSITIDSLKKSLRVTEAINIRLQMEDLIEGRRRGDSIRGVRIQGNSDWENSTSMLGEQWPVSVCFTVV